jgi:hypothetical protein
LKNWNRRNTYLGWALSRRKGKAGFPRAAIPPAFSHHISALSSKLTTVGNCPVGSVN